ncbi:MAG TPA: DUF423 domain-containing protein [Gammaproteobacteria bacterium]|nr:DUF423 domain-containing protein [Gammaproteobacteria bacterium]
MAPSARLFALLAALLLAAATAIGAYTSHGLEGVLAPRDLAIVATAVQYQFYHGLGLLVVALLADRLDGTAVRVAGGLMFGGALLFCGGIYARHLLALEGAGAVAPIGGSAMIASWLVLAYAAVRAKSLARRASGSAGAPLA